MVKYVPRERGKTGKEQETSFPVAEDATRLN
jgi:hypothetical protein